MTKYPEHEQVTIADWTDEQLVSLYWQSVEAARPIEIQIRDREDHEEYVSDEQYLKQESWWVLHNTITTELHQRGFAYDGDVGNWKRR